MLGKETPYRGNIGTQINTYMCAHSRVRTYISQYNFVTISFFCINKKKRLYALKKCYIQIYTFYYFIKTSTARNQMFEMH